MKFNIFEAFLALYIIVIIPPLTDVEAKALIHKKKSNVENETSPEAQVRDRK